MVTTWPRRCTAAPSPPTARAVRIDTPLRPDVVLWIPEETTSTTASRTALPASVPFDDAVFNVGRTATLVAALAAGDVAVLSTATQDRLHQDERFLAAAASRVALTAGLDAGAWCGWLSGSGPTVAFSERLRRRPGGRRCASGRRA